MDERLVRIERELRAHSRADMIEPYLYTAKRAGIRAELDLVFEAAPSNEWGFKALPDITQQEQRHFTIEGEPLENLYWRSCLAATNILKAHEEVPFNGVPLHHLGWWFAENMDLASSGVLEDFQSAVHADSALMPRRWFWSPKIGKRLARFIFYFHLTKAMTQSDSLFLKVVVPYDGIKNPMAFECCALCGRQAFFIEWDTGPTAALDCFETGPEGIIIETEHTNHPNDFIRHEATPDYWLTEARWGGGQSGGGLEMNLWAQPANSIELPQQ